MRFRCMHFAGYNEGDVCTTNPLLLWKGEEEEDQGLHITCATLGSFRDAVQMGREAKSRERETVCVFAIPTNIASVQLVMG